MATARFTAQDWLEREAHLTASGRPFQFNGSSCLPLAPDSSTVHSAPTGFLMTHGQDVHFVPVESEEGREITTRWEEVRFIGIFEELDPVPTEYWIG